MGAIVTYNRVVYDYDTANRILRDAAVEEGLYEYDNECPLLINFGFSKEEYQNAMLDALLDDVHETEGQYVLDCDWEVNIWGEDYEGEPLYIDINAMLEEGEMLAAPENLSEVPARVVRRMAEHAVECGERWVEAEGYPSWFDLISLNENRLSNIFEEFNDIMFGEFKDFVKYSGRTQAQFAKNFFLPRRTVEGWCSGVNECKPYLRLYFADKLGFLHFDVAEKQEAAANATEAIRKKDPTKQELAEAIESHPLYEPYTAKSKESYRYDRDREIKHLMSKSKSELQDMYNVAFDDNGNPYDEDEMDW